MLLSIQQKYILEVLRKLGCIRKSQLLALVQRKFQNINITESRLETMLRQLRVGVGDIRIDDGGVRLSGKQPDALRLESVDVMLELAEGAPEDFTIRLECPGLLRFSWGGDRLRVFTVAALAAPVRPTVELLARERRVVWLSAGGAPLEGLALPPKHFLAVHQTDGSHRFYGSNGP